MCALFALQVRARNLASARAFLHACATSDVADCRILDLFSPTLAWIDDESAYQTGDPVHFRGHLLHGMREWIKRVLRPLVQDVPVKYSREYSGHDSGMHVPRAERLLLTRRWATASTLHPRDDKAPGIGKGKYPK